MADKQFNRFKLTGEMLGLDGSVGIIRTIGFGARGAKFEDEHTVTFATQELAEEAAKHKYVTVIGKLANDENSDTYMLCGMVAKAKKSDPGVNLARLVGLVHTYEFFPPSEGKRQFGSLTLNIDGAFITTTAFRGLASYLKAKAEYGCTVEVVGRNRLTEFSDSAGNIRHSVDVVADGTRTKIVAPSTQGDHFADMKNVAMAFDDGDGAPAESKPAI